MKIGIIGSGPVGLVLGHGFIAEGHEVMLGTSHPDKKGVVDWSTANPGGQIGSFDQTAAFGDLLVLAVPGSAAATALEKAGSANLKNKVIIDASNPIDTSKPPQNGVLSFFTDTNTSLMETLQQQFPEARFVKAFNSVGNGVMYKPTLKEGKPTMFIAGNDEAARKTVSGILADFGWDVEDLGSAKAAGAIEHLSMLWCIPGFQRNSWGHAFKMLRS